MVVLLGCDGATGDGAAARLGEEVAPGEEAAPTPREETDPTPPPPRTADVIYFPPGTFHPDNTAADDHVRQWYGGHLTAMGEPSLHQARTTGIEAYRFLHLPTWDHPVAVRIETRGSTIELTHRVLSGQGGYEPGTLTTDTTRVATAAELDSVRRALATADFWNLPTRAEAGLDGEQWIIEAVRDGRYHVVDRWTPAPDGPHARFVAACTALRDLAVPP